MYKEKEEMSNNQYNNNDISSVVLKVGYPYLCGVERLRPIDFQLRRKDFKAGWLICQILIDYQNYPLTLFTQD